MHEPGVRSELEADSGPIVLSLRGGGGECGERRGENESMGFHCYPHIEVVRHELLRLSRPTRAHSMQTVCTLLPHESPREAEQNR